MSLIKQIASRITAATLVEAVTKEQFDKWDSAKRRQYLKDHPTSKFGKNGDGAALRKNSRDPNTTRIKRTVPKGKHLNKLHPGQSQYHFTDTDGNKHTYSSRKEVESHHKKLGTARARAADAANTSEHWARIARMNHGKAKTARSAAAKNRADATHARNHQKYQRIRDHHDALTKLLRNETFNQEHPKT